MPSIPNQDWTFAQFRWLTPKADTRISASAEESMSGRSDGRTENTGIKRLDNLAVRKR